MRVVAYVRPCGGEAQGACSGPDVRASGEQSLLNVWIGPEVRAEVPRFVELIPVIATDNSRIDRLVVVEVTCSTKRVDLPDVGKQAERHGRKQTMNGGLRDRAVEVICECINYGLVELEPCLARLRHHPEQR